MSPDHRPLSRCVTAWLTSSLSSDKTASTPAELGSVIGEGLMQSAVARVRAFALASALAVASLGFAGAVPAAASGTWQVSVGPVVPFYTQLNRFYLNNITVHPGDEVDFNWLGFHTVTFNPPPNLSLLDFAFFGTPTASNSLDTPSTFVNATPAFSSDPNVAPAPFDLPSGSNLPAGNYRFQCQLHQFMKGVI